jgi:signal peptidase I
MVAPVSDPKDGKKPKKAHPWRDNIEAITVSIVVIVLFKYFVLEAYQIPTGSMQPTLMGWTPSEAVTARLGQTGGVHDRVLVDKFSFHFRDPKRWEVVVFKYPLDRSKNYIKRLVGMPDEVLEIHQGDLFAGPTKDELKILRRPRPVLLSMMRLLDTEGEWRADGGGWSVEGDTLGGDQPGEISFPRTTSGVRDKFEDGYPAGLREAMALEGTGKGSGRRDVGDLRFEARVSAGEDTTALTILLTEARRTYTFTLPGPAANGDAAPTITAPDGEQAGQAWRLPTGSVSIAVQNVDDLLQLEVDGEVVASLEVPPAPQPTGSGVRLISQGGGASFTHVRVLRDIYYTSQGQKRTRWEIPSESYVVLGDNTQDSSDSRDWTFARYSIPGEGEDTVVRGNWRPARRQPGGAAGGNPQSVRNPWGSETVFFHDELGERWVFQNPPAMLLERESCSFVPRSVILGRAVMVVWPLHPGRGVYRIQWVR